jgi:hypothetical protein
VLATPATCSLNTLQRLHYPQRRCDTALMAYVWAARLLPVLGARRRACTPHGLVEHPTGTLRAACLRTVSANPWFSTSFSLPLHSTTCVAAACQRHNASDPTEPLPGQPPSASPARKPRAKRSAAKLKHPATMAKLHGSTQAANGSSMIHSDINVMLSTTADTLLSSDIVPQPMPDGQAVQQKPPSGSPTTDHAALLALAGNTLYAKVPDLHTCNCMPRLTASCLITCYTSIFAGCTFIPTCQQAHGAGCSGQPGCGRSPCKNPEAD